MLYFFLDFNKYWSVRFFFDNTRIRNIRSAITCGCLSYTSVVDSQPLFSAPAEVSRPYPVGPGVVVADAVPGGHQHLSGLEAGSAAEVPRYPSVKLSELILFVCYSVGGREYRNSSV